MFEPSAVMGRVEDFTGAVGGRLKKDVAREGCFLFNI
jgi:hypothetical protein